MTFDAETVKNFHKRNKFENEQHDNIPSFGPSSQGFSLNTKEGTERMVEGETICLHIMKIFNKTYTSFVNMSNHRTEEEKNSILDIWFTYVKIMSPMILNATPESLNSVLQTIEFMIDSPLNDFFYNNYDKIGLVLFEDINNVIQRKADLVLNDSVNRQLLKILVSVYQKKNIDSIGQLLNPQNMNAILHIIRTVLMNLRPTIGLNAMRQENELNEDEDNYFNFIEQFGLIINNYHDPLKYYLSFLLNFIEYDPAAPHFEMFLRRIFSILSENIIQDQYSPSILIALIPELISKTRNIIDLRYNNDC
jgi:hypothetical protein